MNNMLAGYFNPQQTIILIVVSVIGVILIILNIVLAIIFHRRGERKLFSRLLQQQRELYLKQLADMRSNPEFSDSTAPYKPFFNMGAPVEDISQEQPEESEEVVMVDEDQDVVDEVIVDGQVVRYNRSFLARLIQASDLLKNRYSALKNYILSYKGVKNKISWKKETFRVGRKTLATFVVRGKTLCLCTALDPKQFEDTKYKVDDLSVRSPKSKTPCLYRISNDRRFRYAMDLIDMLFIEAQVEKIEHTDMDYTLSIPYETTDALIERDLIRIVGVGAGKADFTLEGVPVEEPAVEEETVVETPVEEPVVIEETVAEVEVEEEVEETEESVEDMDDEAEVFEEVIVNGIVVRYNRSFLARLAQGGPVLNARYSELKNYMLSYKGVKNRISWKKETFNQGRNNLAVFVVRGKSLCLCLALDPKQFEDTKYKVKDLSIRSPKSKTPCLYRLTNDRRVKYAKELIDLLFAQQFGLVFKERETEDFTVPYATTEELIARDLIRVINKESEVVVADESVEPEETVVETPVEEPVSVEEPVAEVQEEVVAETLEVEETEEAEEESEEALETVEDMDDEAEVFEEVIVNGIVVRYNRSFLARLAQGTPVLNARYSELKNYMLSYKGVKNRISWKKETFNQGRNNLAVFVVRGKSLCLCLALDPKQFEDTKYKVKDLSIRSPKSKTPCLYRLTNDRRVKYAKELIDLLFAQQFELVFKEKEAEDFTVPHATTEELIERELIRVNNKTVEETVVVAGESVEAQEETVVETPVEEPVAEVQEEIAETTE